MRTKAKMSIYMITATAIMGALAVILQMFEFPIPFLIPTFVKFDFSDLPVLMSSFLIGPISGVITALIKNLVHILTSQSAGVGELANFLTSAPIAICAGLIYKHRKTKKTAIISCAVGSAASAAASIPINYFITYPFYMNAMNFPLEAILAAYNEINPALSLDLLGCLIVFNMPFTFFKFAVVSVITIIIYKPVSKALHGVTSRADRLPPI